MSLLTMNTTLDEVSAKHFDVFVWGDEEDDYFGGDEHMPASPDTVCLDKTGKLISAEEPLPLNVLNFEPEFFAEKHMDFDHFRLFDIQHVPDAETSSEPSVESSAALDVPSRPNVVTAKRSVEAVIQEQPARKRSKTLMCHTSDSSDDECKPKKSKASPKLPRSRKPTSAYRGVSRCTKDGRWQARIRVAKEVVYLGRFPTEEQAARRYDEAARLHHGAAAMLNFVTPEDILMGRKSVFSMDKSAVDQEEF